MGLEFMCKACNDSLVEVLELPKYRLFEFGRLLPRKSVLGCFVGIGFIALALRKRGKLRAALKRLRLHC